jgi:hypothetical protein
MLGVLFFIFEDLGEPSTLPTLGLAAVGLVGFSLARWASRHALDTTSAESLAKAYRSHLFLGFGVSEAPLLVGYVVTFLEQELWPYLLVSPFFIFGMRAIAPTNRNLERREQEVRAAGSPLSLRHALENDGNT